MGTGRSEWGVPLPLITTHVPSLPLSLHATLSKSAVCGSLSLRLLRTTGVVSAQSLPNNQRNSTPHLKQRRFFTGPHISSPTGNFPLSPFVRKCCLLPQVWVSSDMLGPSNLLSSATHQHSKSLLSSWKQLSSFTLKNLGFACKLAKKKKNNNKTEAHLSQPHSPIEVFYPSKSPSSVILMLFFP